MSIIIMIVLYCTVFFFVISVGHALDLPDPIFVYTAQRIESIEERSKDWVRDERPNFHDRCLHSHVCSGTAEERWQRCEEAVNTDYCRQQGIKLSSTFKRLGEPKVYEYVLLESCTEIGLACVCPTRPKRILLTDAYGYSIGQVNVLVDEPKPLTKKQQLDALAETFTGKAKDTLPIGNRTEDKPQILDDSTEDAYYSSDSPDKDLHQIAKPSTVKAQLGGYKDKIADKIKDALSNETKDKTKHSSLPNDSLSRSISLQDRALGSNSSADSVAEKSSFWRRKKQPKGDDGSGTVQTSNRRLSPVQSFGDSRFEPIGSSGDDRFESLYATDGEDETYESNSNTSSPDSPRASSCTGEEDPVDFENLFANMGTGQSSTGEDADKSSEKKKGSSVVPLKRGQKIKKMKKTVRSMFK